MSLSTAKLERQIEALVELPRDELVEKWIKLFGAEPFKGARNVTLFRGIAYKLQEKRLGGLSASASSALLKIARGDWEKVQSNLSKLPDPE